MSRTLQKVRPDYSLVEMKRVWRFAGGFGKFADCTQADIISTVEFDQTGNYLATGDKGGRVVLFERNDTVRKNALLGGLDLQRDLTNLSRKKHASISFTPNFNPTSPNSTTSSL